MFYCRMRFGTPEKFKNQMPDVIANFVMPLGYSESDINGQTEIVLDWVGLGDKPAGIVEVIGDAINIYDFTRHRTVARAWWRWGPTTTVHWHVKCPSTLRISVDAAFQPAIHRLLREQMKNRPISKSEVFALHREAVIAGAWAAARGIWKLFIVPRSLVITRREWVERLEKGRR